MHDFIGFETTFTGVFRGAKAQEKQNRDGTKRWIQQSIFVEGRDFNTFEFRLNREAVEKGIFSQLKQFENKLVTIPVRSQSRVWDGRIYTDHYLKGTDLPQIVQSNQQKAG